MSSFYWDSGNSFGDSQGSSSRWDFDETPPFPGRLCTSLSPRPPRRSNTYEGDLIDRMIREGSDEEGDLSLSENVLSNGTPDALLSMDQEQQLRREYYDNDDETRRDCRRQNLAPPRLPQRQKSYNNSCVANYGSTVSTTSLDRTNRPIDCRLTRMRGRLRLTRRSNSDAKRYDIAPRLPERDDDYRRSNTM